MLSNSFQSIFISTITNAFHSKMASPRLKSGARPRKLLLSATGRLFLCLLFREQSIRPFRLFHLRPDRRKHAGRSPARIGDTFSALTQPQQPFAVDAPPAPTAVHSRSCAAASSIARSITSRFFCTSAPLAKGYIASLTPAPPLPAHSGTHSRPCRTRRRCRSSPRARAQSPAPHRPASKGCPG